MTVPTSPERNSDPLLPRFWQRVKRLAASSGFPHLLSGVLVFLFALWLGGAPDLNFGFVSSFNEPGSPVPAPTTASTTTIPESTTTTSDVVSDRELGQLLTEIGFPELSLEAEGSTVVVSGIVPDDASRRVVLERVLAIDDVTDVVDELEVRSAPVPAAAAIELTGSSARLAGRVPDEATAERLRGVLASVYLRQQISAELLVVDPDVAPLDSLAVTGAVTDPELASLLTEVFESLDSVQATVDITVATKPRVETELDELLAGQPLQFATADDELSEEAGIILDEVAAILAQFPSASIEVGGHTDGQGDEAENLALSQRRAAAVVAGLRQRGVELALTPAGYGERRPRVSPERSDEDRAQNRRIEFRLLNG